MTKPANVVSEQLVCQVCHYPDFLHRFPHLHELRCGCLRMCFELSPFSPMIGVVVMPGVAPQQAGFSTMTRTSLLTRIDQNRRSFGRSSLWNCRLGCAGFT
jgi:hypothetical protein